MDFHYSSYSRPSTSLELEGPLDFRLAPRFPPEITDMIIHLVQDRETLIACSKVSRSFVPVSRQYLFRQISVGNPSIESGRSIRLTLNYYQSPHTFRQDVGVAS